MFNDKHVLLNRQHRRNNNNNNNNNIADDDINDDNGDSSDNNDKWYTPTPPRPLTVSAKLSSSVLIPKPLHSPNAPLKQNIPTSSRSLFTQPNGSSSYDGHESRTNSVEFKVSPKERKEMRSSESSLLGAKPLPMHTTPIKTIPTNKLNSLSKRDLVSTVEQQSSIVSI